MHVRGIFPVALGLALLCPAANADSTITADELVDLVLANNPTLPAARAEWHAAKERVEAAGALDDPSFTYYLAPKTLWGSRDAPRGHNSSRHRISRGKEYCACRSALRPKNPRQPVTASRRPG